MDTKLTLKLNERVIEEAKKYAHRRQISLSRLIENYLEAMIGKQENNVEISAFVKSISSGKSISPDIDDKDLKEAYRTHLDEKYQ